MLEVRQLTKRFDGVTVFADVTFSATPGTITGIIGRNGTGKTTLLRTIMGIWLPDSGTVFCAGRNVHVDAEARAHLLLIPDTRDLLSDYTPRQCARLFAWLYPHFDEQAFQTWLDQFALSPRQKIQNFSKGMKTLFYLSLAFATRAEVLLLDEPIDGLDPLFKQQCLRLIVKEVAEHRTTVLISSHRLEELQSICDRVFLKGSSGGTLFDVSRLAERYEKLQVAFTHDDGGETLAQFPSLRVLARSGRVYTVMVDQGPPDLAERLQAAGAVLVEPLPLKLEDLFIGEWGGKELASEGALD